MLDTTNTTPTEIAERVNHFSALSTKLKSEGQAFNLGSRSIKEKLDAASNALAAASRAQAPAIQETIDRLKRERAARRPPVNYDAWGEIESYLARGLTLTAAPAPARKNLATASRDADNIIRKVQSVISAPKPDTARLETLQAGVNAMCDMGAPGVDKDGRLTLPMGAIATAPRPTLFEDKAAFVMWALRPLLLQAVASLAPTQDGIGLTDGERASQLETLAIDLTEALRCESDAAMADERAGASVIRRRHVHPAVLVGAVVNPNIVLDHLVRRRGSA